MAAQAAAAVTLAKDAVLIQGEYFVNVVDVDTGNQPQLCVKFTCKGWSCKLTLPPMQCGNRHNVTSAYG